MSFDSDVKSDEGYLKPSKKRIVESIQRNESLSGSLYGKITDITWGDDLKFSIDNAIESVHKALESI